MIHRFQSLLPYVPCRLMTKAIVALHNFPFSVALNKFGLFLFLLKLLLTSFDPNSLVMLCVFLLLSNLPSIFPDNGQLVKDMTCLLLYYFYFIIYNRMSYNNSKYKFIEGFFLQTKYQELRK